MNFGAARVRYGISALMPYLRAAKAAWAFEKV